MSQAAPTASYPFPLHELLAFEAAARHGSFQKAADELSVTQSAVSHRVIRLERRLGTALFVRKGRGIELTPQGADHLDGVSAALSALWAAGEELRMAEHALVRVACAPSIGQVWLLPQLPGFLRARPELQIEVASIATPEESSRTDWDVLVHYGGGGADEARRQPLLTDEVLVVAPPGFLGARRTALQPDDLAGLTLLRHTLLSWPDWCVGAFGRRLEPARSLHFDDSITLLEAVAGGAGVALATRVAATPYLASGALVPVHPFALRGNAYYVALSEGGELKPAARALVDWMVRRAAPGPRQA